MSDPIILEKKNLSAKETKIGKEFFPNFKENDKYNLEITCIPKQVDNSNHPYSYIKSKTYSDINIIKRFCSPEQIIEIISENLINNDIEDLISYNYENIIQEKIIKNKSIGMTDNNAINTLIKFDLDDKNDIIIFGQNCSHHTLTMKLNYEKRFILKDTTFTLDIKKILESINDHMKTLKSIHKKKIDNIKQFFIPLKENEHIGLIIAKNSNSDEKKINNASDITQKYILKSIIIALNLSSISKENNCNENNKENEDDRIIDFNRYDSTLASTVYNIPIINVHNNQLLEEEKYFNEKTDINSNLENDEWNKFQNQNNKQKYKKRFNIKQKFRQFKYSINNDKNNMNKFSKCNNSCNKIILNSDDLFTKTLFNIYQDKSNSTCNFKILL